MTMFLRVFQILIAMHNEGRHDAANAPTDPEKRAEWERDRSICPCCNPPVKREA